MIPIGTTVWETDDPTKIRVVVGDPWEAYRLNPGEFLLESWNGYRTIGRLTGRTRIFWGIACPTIERFAIETYADADGVILGRTAEPIAGTLAVRPEHVHET
jgi:hypothetical protein